MMIKQNKPEVSVVIPTRNRAKMLQRALESVIYQTFENWEAVVVDDDSEDNTVEVVARFNDPRIRLVNFKSNGVIAACRNHSIRVSRGLIIAFLDSDDCWYPKKLERCLEAMTAEVDLVAHGLVYKKNGRILRKRLSGPAKRASYKQLLYTGNCLATSAVMVRKKCLERASGFFEDPVHVVAEDYDLWLRLAKNRTRFAFVNEMLGEYYFHSGNVNKDPWCFIKAQLAVIERHFADIGDKSLIEWIRRQRRRALVFYTAARGLQDDRMKTEALRLYCRSALIFPFAFKIYVAMILTICGWSH